MSHERAGYQVKVARDGIGLLLCYSYDGGSDANLMSTRLMKQLRPTMQFSDIKGLDNCSSDRIKPMVHLGVPAEGELYPITSGIEGKPQHPSWGALGAS